MPILPVAAVLLACALSVDPAAFSQPYVQESRAKEASGSVSGRVTLGGKPLANVTVVLSSDTPPWEPHAPPAKATTDEDGRFRITGVAKGNYTVGAYAPAYVGPQIPRYGFSGKAVTLDDGEAVEGLSVALERGGGITGRVTDAEGQPVIEQSIRLDQVDRNGAPAPEILPVSVFRFSTDDRGVYRIYGLPAGFYKVSVGVSPTDRSVRIGFAGGFFARTFHPDASEAARAAIVEVTAGGEATGVDIKVGRALKTYTASGRVIDAENGASVAGLRYGHGPLVGDAKRIGGFGTTSNRTDTEGRFRIEGLHPGRYAAFAISDTQTDFYSEPAVFEVTDEDAAGIEIKIRRGASISGVAVIEGTDDPALTGQLSQLRLIASIQTDQLAAPRIAPANLAPDGSFRITGLQPGKVRVTLSEEPKRPKGLSRYVRLEGEAADQQGNIDVSSGANISGVRAVISYGSGVIRGQLKIEGGNLPDGTVLIAFARRLSNPPQPGPNIEADARGRFVLEGVVPGEYEVSVIPSPPLRKGPPFPKKTVTAVNGAEVEVVLVIDLSALSNDKDR